ncbi:hypothetical protein [Flaviaesturariibacter terrae]
MPKTQPDATHSTNINNLAAAAAACRTLGATFAPEEESCKPAVVEAFCTDCEVTLTATYRKERLYGEARETRRALFDGQAQLGTRIVNALKSCKASEGIEQEARSLVQKVRGERISRQPKPAASDTPAEEISKQISVSQTSFDNRLEHFRKMVGLCRGLGAAYKAPSADLKLDKLEERLAQMSSANSAVATAGSDYTAALIARDRLLYDKQTGIVARMDAIRTYLVASYGATSAERKLLNGLRVRDLSVRRLQAVWPAAGESISAQGIAPYPSLHAFQLPGT